MTPISSAASQLRTTLATLRGKGMEPGVGDGNVALAVASADLAADRSLPVRFTDLTVASSLNGKSCRVEDEARFQTFGLSRAQLTRLAAVVSGDTTALSGDEQKALSAVQTLIQKGATFQMATFHTNADDKNIRTTITLPPSTATQGLVVLRPEMQDSLGRSLSVMLDGTQYPICSLDHLVQTSEGKSLESAASNLKSTVDALRRHGVDVAVGDSVGALSAAARRLEAGERLDVRFKQAPVTSTRAGKPHNPPEKRIQDMQTLQLNASQLKTATAILEGRDHDLSDDERIDLAAIDSLQKSGASFQIRQRHFEGGMIADFLMKSGAELHDTLAVPADNSGRALALLHLASYRFDKKLAVVIDGKPYPLDFTASLREVADSNCAAMLLQTTLETLRANGVDVNVDNNAVAMQVAATRLEGKQTINVSFKDVPVASTQGNSVPPEAQASMRNFSLGTQDLTHVGTILGGNEDLLSHDDKMAFEAIDTLRRSGARFEVSRTREQRREVLSNRAFTDTMRVPDGKLGNALIVAALASTQREGLTREGRKLKFVADDVSYDFRSLADLVAVAEHLHADKTA